MSRLSARCSVWVGVFVRKACLGRRYVHFFSLVFSSLRFFFDLLSAIVDGKGLQVRCRAAGASRRRSAIATPVLPLELGGLSGIYGV